jgi:type IV pilus assembly protein PilX
MSAPASLPWGASRAPALSCGRLRVRPAAPARARASERGISLIVALLLLAVIGIASAAIIRNATSGDQVASNYRLQTQASQYAQLALRFCESQLELPAADRVAALAPAPVGAPPAWAGAANWIGGGAHPAHTLAAAEIGGALQPRVAPQCLAEATDTAEVYTVTVRGFSADFHADAKSGATRSGAAVWLQATLVATDRGPVGACTADCGLTVQQRLVQLLLTPPF